MCITWIIAKDQNDNILYSDYWKGPIMTVALRQELREVLLYSDNPVVDVFYTMCNYGYSRVDPNIEQFEVRR